MAERTSGKLKGKENMAINFSAYTEEVATREISDTKEKLNYFSLKDGEKKSVVINFDPQSEKVYFVHNYFSQADSRYTKIKCLGQGCPLCAKARSYGKDEKNFFKSWASPRVFLQLFDEDGVEYVWERPYKFVQSNIVPLIENLGDLSKVFVTITRTGERIETKYNVLPVLVKGSIKQASDELLETIKNSVRVDAARRMFLDLDIDMIEDFLETGKVNFGAKADDYVKEEIIKDEATMIAEENEIPF